MKRKKKNKKKQASTSPLTQEQKALIALLIQEAANKDPADILARIPDSNCARALIDGLPFKDETAIPLLLALRDSFKEKKVERAIKRVLYRMKKKGVATEAFDTEDIGSSPSALKPLEKAPPVCWVGPIYGFGFRSVLLILDRKGRGLDVGFGMVSDEDGIQEFFFSNVSKKAAKELQGNISEQTGPLIKTSLSHAMAILEKAYRKQLEEKSQVPDDYLELRPWLMENVSAPDRFDIHDLMPEINDKQDILTVSRLREFFDHELMDSWLIESESLRPCITDMANMHDSPIVLTETQKSARTREIKEKHMADIFPAGKRDLLRKRLEEMGYFFFKLGQEETAGMALAAAKAVAQEASILNTNPVVETLFERSLKIYTEGMENRGLEKTEDENESSPIILS